MHGLSKDEDLLCHWTNLTSTWKVNWPWNTQILRHGWPAKGITCIGQKRKELFQSQSKWFKCMLVHEESLCTHSLKLSDAITPVVSALGLCGKRYPAALRAAMSKLLLSSLLSNARATGERWKCVFSHSARAKACCDVWIFCWVCRNSYRLLVKDLRMWKVNWSYLPADVPDNQKHEFAELQARNNNLPLLDFHNLRVFSFTEDLCLKNFLLWQRLVKTN